MAERGFFGIGICNGKFSVNVGGLWRSAQAFGADFIFTIGDRYQKQPTDTTKASRHVPLFHFSNEDQFLNGLPRKSRLVAVENSWPNTRDLSTYHHPEQAVYVLGAEDYGVPNGILYKADSVIEIASRYCLNVAVAGSIVMYDRASDD